MTRYAPPIIAAALLAACGSKENPAPPVQNEVIVRSEAQQQLFNLSYLKRAIALNRAIADQGLLRGTGARGLRAILEEVLLNVMYELPSETDVGKVVVDAETVLEKVNPTLVPRSSQRAQRPRRAAS